MSRRARVVLLAGSIAVPLAALGAVLALDGGDTGTPRGEVGPGAPEVGSPAPDFELEMLTGGSLRLSDLRGRNVVLTFFASWCNPCEKEMPILQGAAEEHRDELTVVAVTYEDLRMDAERFVDRLGVTYPTLFDPPRTKDVARRYGVRGIPVTFFIDADGTVRDRVFGITTERSLRAPLEALLDGR